MDFILFDRTDLYIDFRYDRRRPNEVFNESIIYPIRRIIGISTMI